MEQKSYLVRGTMRGPSTVELAEAVPLGNVGVEVLLKPVEPAARPPIRTFLAGVWEQQRRAGHKPRAAEDVVRDLRADRQSW